MTTRTTFLAATALSLGLAAPVAAQDTNPPGPLTVAGTVALVSDYRFRGVSQSDKQAAVQGGLTVTHESGVHAGAWASNLAGWGTFGGANMELDLFGGVKLPVGDGTLDVGLTWYMYPGGYDKTYFADPYAKLSGTIGPVGLLAGIAYAPRQQALGNWSNTPQSRTGDAEDNFYVWGDATVAVVGTPFTARAHVGYSDGNPGLGPNGTSVAPTGQYADWQLGLDYALTPVTLSVAYIDTDIGRARSAYLLPNFSSTQGGSPIAGSRLVLSVAASY